LGWLNFNRGQWVDAAWYFEMFWQKSPQDPRLAGVVEALASAYEEMGQLDLAVQVCEQFLETDPANSRIKARLEKLEGATK